MPKLSRRRFVAASAASAAGAAAPAWGATGPDAEIVVIGAGAAGIAAARRIATTRARVIVLEAADRIGGRCFTDTTTFGVPYDRGAHWIHMPELNPVAVLASTVGLDVYPAPRRRSSASAAAMPARSRWRITSPPWCGRTARSLEAGRGSADISCAPALPKDLGDWQPTVEFVLGPFGCGKNLPKSRRWIFRNRPSATSMRSAGRALAPWSQSSARAAGAAVEPGQGDRPLAAAPTSKSAPRAARITARAVIVTASTGVLLDNRIQFEPDLPRRYTDALQGSRSAATTTSRWNCRAIRSAWQRDEVVFEKSSSARTGAILANIAGTTLCTVEVGGKFGRDLSAQGEPAMVEFALDWLTGLYGSEVKKAVKRTHATQWNKEPWALGAFSAAAPGGQPRPHGACRAVPRPAVVRGRSRPRDAVGYRRRRLGVRRPRGRRRRCARSAPSPSRRPSRRSPAAAGRRR